MQSILDKAYARSDALAAINFSRAMQLKAAGAGVLSITSSMDAGGFGKMQEQSAQRRKYALYRGWTYSAVHAKAVAAASQPVNVARIKGAKPREEEANASPSSVKGYMRLKMPPALQTKTAKQELEVVIDHALIDLLDKPNSVQNRWQFVYSFAANLDLTGWAFLVAGENSETKQLEIWSLPTTWVQPLHNKGPFSSFKIVNPKDPAAEGMELDREFVAFAYLPDPANPLSALPPTAAQMPAIRIDDHIMTSQEAFFENGIFPSMIVTVGKDPHPDVPGGIRPRLSPAQRRQVIGAIQKTTQGVANYGGLAIVDGLIESFTRLSAAANEMGWDKSEGSARTRILSSYGVHPFMLGEPMNVGGYAQAAVIKGIFCDRVNIPLWMLGQLCTNFVAPKIEASDRLVVWWDEAEPKDPQREDLNWREARKNGDISRNENRARLGLPPDEQATDRSALLSTASGMTGATQILTAMGNNYITAHTAAQLFMLFFEIPIERAEEIIGSDEDQSVGQVVETLEEVVRQIGAPLQVKFDSTEMDVALAKLLSVAEKTAEKVKDGGADDRAMEKAVQSVSSHVSGCVEKAIHKFELTAARQVSEEKKTEMVQSVLMELSREVEEGMQTIQKVAQQPVEVVVHNEVETPTVGATVEVPNVEAQNE